MKQVEVESLFGFIGSLSHKYEWNAATTHATFLVFQEMISGNSSSVEYNALLLIGAAD